MPTPNNDAAYLASLRDYYSRYRCIPSYDRLCSLWGVSSRATVAKALERLRQHDLIQRTPDGDWVPAHQFFARLMAHQSVRAGLPDADLDAGLTPVLLDDLLVDNPSKTLLVTVTGDSMIEANIFDGDVVIIERAERGSIGDIVVALVDGELTVKRLLRDAGGWVLHPENPNYPDIRPHGELRLIGIVIGLARRLKKSL